jgi:hypothetical protein
MPLCGLKIVHIRKAAQRRQSSATLTLNFERLLAKNLRHSAK